MLRRGRELGQQFRVDSIRCAAAAKSGHPTSGMSATDAWNAGYHQSQTAQELAGYQSAKGYGSQTADAASDMEPSWDGAAITKQLVNGDAAISS